MRSSLVAIALLGAGLAAVLAASALDAGTQRTPPKAPVAIHKIKHVIVIMQENRSFDQYFGTYPGADGLPREANGDFAVCVPDPLKGACDEAVSRHERSQRRRPSRQPRMRSPTSTGAR